MAETTPKPAAAPAPTGKKILIVEDERPLAHALELKLSHSGYQVQTANTGAKGLEKAVAEPFDLILMDLILPEMDGFAVLTQMRAKGVKTPVVVLSNLGQDEDRKKATALGVKNYLVKSNAPLADIVKMISSLT